MFLLHVSLTKTNQVGQISSVGTFELEFELVVCSYLLTRLLDTGSSAFIRNTAADQLAETQKSHPEELLNLLGRVLPYLKSRKWETRVAAARAIGGIANYAPKWEDLDVDQLEETNAATVTEVKVEDEDVEMPLAGIKTEEDIKTEDIKTEATTEAVPTQSDLLTFAKLDMKLILRLGNKLVGSAGKEYDDPYQNLEPVERLRRQKLGLQQKLGMEFMDDDLLNEGDVKSAASRSRSSSPPAQQAPQIKRQSSSSNGRLGRGSTIKQEASTPVAAESAEEKDSPALARKRALAKRRAKSVARNASKLPQPVSLGGRSTSYSAGNNDKTSANGNSYDVTDQADSNKVVVEHKVQQPILTTDNKSWPFEMLCQILMGDLFADAWEVRHGAAMGLREIVRVHGAGAGKVMGLSDAENDQRNRAWLENLACSLCCIFALDRFGDYLSDQVVAPVRESAAQTLGAALLHIPDDVAELTFKTLQQLVMQNQLDIVTPIWEVCHGGMLGLKYFVSVRKEQLTQEQLDQIISCVLHGLDESDDDVQACAAATLLPITDELVSQRSNQLPVVLDIIWSCLDDLTDDLSASIGNVMDLLAKLCTYPQVLSILLNAKGSLSVQVPRLYPFLRHSITNVRKSVLKALSTFATLSCGWIDGKALRLVFQNMLVEQNEEALTLSSKLWQDMIEASRASSNSGDHDLLAASFMNQATDLVKFLQTPIGAAGSSYKMDRLLFLRPSGSSHQEERPSSRKRKLQDNHPNLRVNIDNAMLDGDVTLIEPAVMVRCRLAASRAFGSAMAILPKENQLQVLQAVQQGLESPFSTPRMVVGLVLQEYSLACLRFNVPNNLECTADLLSNALSASPPFYRNQVPYLRAVRTQCQTLFDTLQDMGKISRSKLPSLAVVTQGDTDAGPDAFSLSQAENISEELYPKLLYSMPVAKRTTYGQVFTDAHQSLEHAIAVAQQSKQMADIQIHATLAAAYILLASKLPKKLNPLIRSLMESVKNEENEELQRRSSQSVAHLIKRLLDEQSASVPVDKMVKNLCVFLCVDTSEVPEFEPNAEFKDIILSLRKEDAKADAASQALHQREAKMAKVKRRGAIQSLKELAQLYGSNLFEKIPKILECMTKEIETSSLQAAEDAPSIRSGQPIIDALAVIKALLPSLETGLHDQVLAYHTNVIKVMSSEYSVLRYAAARCFATMCAVAPGKSFPVLVKDVLPMLLDADNLHKRQGAIECIYHLTTSMGVDILPYIMFLIVPVLGRMSDANNDIRLLATTTFASIIKLVPLESGIPDPPDMPQELLAGREKEREFISQMLDPTKAANYKLPVAIKADLRKYQQAGVNWLAFLNKYHLHGILCDDMGLGKTLQTICIVASDHHQRAEEYAKTQSDEWRKIPSLVVCPPSLTGHWKHELNTYAPFLKVLVYVGLPTWRATAKDTFGQYDVVVTSYDIARNDISDVSAQNWNYCVLDEGHVIKNASSKLTKAVKTIKANHRLILSGTPIQNNVLELWSLFDFLMPGFLGTEKVFNERFARPIAASRTGKASSKDQEAGALALEVLHKQVLPFLLRRLKEDVLSDLPPKIIQDYYCDLSDLQRTLYESFIKKEKSSVVNAFGHDGKNQPEKQHVFQALQYMRKLCNHPALVMNPNHPLYEQVNQTLRAKHQSLRDIEHAPKLQALKELLLDCGIGLDQPSPSTNSQALSAASATTALPVTSQHRALIFCQLKDMLNMVENDLLKKLMPSVSYMRLDGSTEASKRQDIVHKFNSDPSIDVLLLTTHVGGLGLNLTGADTVIFVEHDWNPMNDLQAMDRAHRIGQKKVVNVYRLITRNTLEEKIMGLQKFKMNIASTIINQQNSGLASMGTDQIFDLFSMDEAPEIRNGGDEVDEEQTAADQQVSAVPKAVGELEELWGDQQYVDEYNLDNFIQNLRN